jgi:hypothetical protein
MELIKTLGGVGRFLPDDGGVVACSLVVFSGELTVFFFEFVFDFWGFFALRLFFWVPLSPKH